MASAGSRLRVLAFFLGAMIIAGCGKEVELVDGLQYKRLSDLSSDDVRGISRQSYYFGHQSVGNDILDGLALVMRDHPDVALNIVEGVDPNEIHTGVLLHSEVGRNRTPQTKIDAFQALLQSGLGNSVDTAFVKFCYTDAGRESDIHPEALFSSYKAMIESVQSQFPQTRIVHFTMPLRTVPVGIKVRLKKLIGRDIPEYGDNIQRERFNEMLRQEYGGKEPLFDVAYLESVAPATKTVHTFTMGGEAYHSLLPEYTYDGGHLNEAGKRWIAEQFLVFLAELGEPDREVVVSDRQ